MEGRKPEYPEKTLDDEVRNMPCPTARKFKPNRDLNTRAVSLVAGTNWENVLTVTPLAIETISPHHSILTPDQPVPALTK